LRSPVEKSAKSIFSVSPFPTKATFSKPVDSNENLISDEPGVNGFAKFDQFPSIQIEDHSTNQSKIQSEHTDSITWSIVTFLLSILYRLDRNLKF